MRFWFGSKGSLSGEDKAVRFLKKKKYKILKRNYRVKSGEIDIVARNGLFIIFIEVKQRKNPLYHPVYDVDKSKQKRIISASSYFLLTNKTFLKLQPRYDVVTISGESENEVTEHFENAFS